jgi:hypothetical protein
MGTDQRTPNEQSSVPAWGDSLDGLTQERKEELARRLWDWTPEMATEHRPGPFAGERLNGLEVVWLAICAVAGRGGDAVKAERQLQQRNRQIKIVSLQLQGAILYAVRLEQANLSFAQLQGANLSWAQLQRTDLSFAQLHGAILYGAQLQGADLSETRLEGADLSGAQL